MTRTELVALAAAMLQAAAGTATPAPGSAQAAVEAIYRALPRDSFDFRTLLYAPGLRQLLARERAAAHGEEGLIDAVPFCDCQDTADDYAFTATTRATGPASAEVTVHLRNETRSTYRLDMARLPAGWAVADVHGPEHPSLVAWLRAGLRRH